MVFKFDGEMNLSNYIRQDFPGDRTFESMPKKKLGIGGLFFTDEHIAGYES